MPGHVTPKAERVGPRSARLTLEDGSVVEITRLASRVTFEAERDGVQVEISVDESGFAFALGVLYPDGLEAARLALAARGES